MENKKQDVNSLEELVKEVNAYGRLFANLADELSKVLADIKAHDEEENTWEMKRPYNDGDKYWYVYDNLVECEYWEDTSFDTERFDTGNVFPSEEEALLEVKRRNLLTRFKSFRDERNGDWEPDWKNVYENKYFICKVDSKLGAYASSIGNSFAMFGYFKNSEDCERAIELFGDEIKELFVE